jgi:NADPH:quinone reductase-like Zn-dependent oxidoreductase
LRVRAFSAGERVLFFADPGDVAQDGTFAEIASVPSGNLAPMPRRDSE